jgi:protein-L-isoaspartate(D-aspartate) O-methyltransferase
MMPDSHTGNRWRQVNVRCADWKAAEQMALADLGPRLVDAERAGTISCWWFVRKGASWRVRALPAAGQDERATAFLDQTMDDLITRGAIQSWMRGIYEPELHAFGGEDAMEIAHELFCADSHHLLAHLGRVGADHRRELGLLLASTLLRGAGQDFYEQGDVWARVAAHRLTNQPPPLSDTSVTAVRRLITAGTDTSSALLQTTPGWPEAFQRAGRALAQLAHHGTLTRGLRAVLAHHVLFSWNRSGIPAGQQGLLAAAAAQVIFHHDPALITPLAVPSVTTLSAVTSHSTDTSTPSIEELQDALIEQIRALGRLHTPGVEAAFRAVPRHVFLPGVDMATAYARQVVITKRADDGTALSSASSPDLVAAMLEQLQAHPGQRVLEIGAATGINAALLAELVGPGGQVVTIEIDDDLAAGARASLAAAGYDQVEVICADGAAGSPGHAPFDRIIVTAGAWDVPAAWWQQLAVGGRLVVPVRLHASGLTRSLAFEFQHTGRMVSRSAQVCGFVPMRGAASYGGRSLQLADGVTLNLDGSELDDETALSQVLAHPAREMWTGIEIRDDASVEHLDLWLVTTGHRFARLAAGPQARQSGLVAPALRWAGAALHEGGNIAYLAFRSHGDRRNELGVIAHGPDNAKLADHTVDLLHEWNHQRPNQPVITAYPAGTPDDQLASGYRIDRPDTRLIIAW